MNERLLHARQLCLDQAAGFIDAAERLSGAALSHIVYHLSLLALEEVGKANILRARMITHATLDGSWIERALDSHRRKLQWAVWSPMIRIDPADFESARQFAERAHAGRLASLYVDANADLTDAPPSEQVGRRMQSRHCHWPASGSTMNGNTEHRPVRSTSLQNGFSTRWPTLIGRPCCGVRLSPPSLKR